MFDDIKAHVTDWSDQDAVYQYLLRILAGEAGDHSGLIYGMGHAIYTLSDPRAGSLQGDVHARWPRKRVISTSSTSSRPSSA